jgi:hypothetical protein
MFKKEGSAAGPVSTIATYEINGESSFQLDTGLGFTKVYMHLKGGNSGVANLQFTKKGIAYTASYSSSFIYGSGSSNSTGNIALYGYSNGSESIASIDVYIGPNFSSVAAIGKNNSAFSASGHLAQDVDGFKLIFPTGRTGIIIVESYNV